MNLPKSAPLGWLRDLIAMMATEQNNDLAVRRIERDARVLLDKHGERPETCWLVLAFTAFLQGDPDECVRCADAAYRLAQHDAVILANVASLLANVGEPRLAAVFAERLARLSGGEPDLAIRAARVFCVVLHLEAAADFMRSPQVRHALREHPSILEDDAILREIDAVVSVFRPSCVNADLRVALLESAVSAVRAEGFAVRRVMPIHYQEDGTMRYELFVQASPLECGKLSFGIANALVNNFDDAYAELITFSCRPLASFWSSHVASGTLS